MISTLYHCPKCENKIDITATYNVDPDFGETIEIEVYCPSCQDRRYTSIDEFQYGTTIKDIVAKLGT